jgi:hypothetical protein
MLSFRGRAWSSSDAGGARFHHRQEIDGELVHRPAGSGHLVQEAWKDARPVESAGAGHHLDVLDVLGHEAGHLHQRPVVLLGDPELELFEEVREYPLQAAFEAKGSFVGRGFGQGDVEPRLLPGRRASIRDGAGIEGRVDIDGAPSQPERDGRGRAADDHQADGLLEVGVDGPEKAEEVVAGEAVHRMNFLNRVAKSSSVMFI